MRPPLLPATWILLGLACAAPEGTTPQPAPPAQAPAPVARLEDRFPSEFLTCHYGLYVFDEKAGYLRTSGKRDPDTQEIHEEFHMEMSLVTEGVVSSSVFDSRSIYAADPPHVLLFKEDVSLESGQEERKVFNARGPVGKVGVFAHGEANVHEGMRSAEALEPRLEASLRVGRGAPGSREEVPEFDIDRQADQTDVCEFVGLEELDVGGTERKLRHFRLTTAGDKGAMDLFLDEHDVTVVMRLQEVFEARLEEASAARENIAPVDAFARTTVTVEGFDGDPERLRRLEWEWSGAKELLPERAGQTARWKTPGELQILRTERMRKPSQAARALAIPEDVRIELQPDSLCNSDHPRIRALAEEIVGDARDPWRKVELVLAWMQRNITGSFDANHATALAVLDAKDGDCTEFSVLASGLLRAAGVPTRRVDGLVLTSDRPGELLGHAWVEVWIGEWIPVDPTFGEAPADCGHVCFGGERDTQFIGTPGMHARIVEQR